MFFLLGTKLSFVLFLMFLFWHRTHACCCFPRHPFSLFVLIYLLLSPVDSCPDGLTTTNNVAVCFCRRSDPPVSYILSFLSVQIHAPHPQKKTLQQFAVEKNIYANWFDFRFCDTHEFRAAHGFLLCLGMWIKKKKRCIEKCFFLLSKLLLKQGCPKFGPRGHFMPSFLDWLISPSINKIFECYNVMDHCLDG